MIAAAIVLALTTPLFLAALCVPRAGRVPAWRLAPWAALPALLLSIFWPGHGSLELDWILLGARLGLTDLTRVFLLFTALLWLSAAHFARGYLEQDPRRVRFLAFFLASMAGNIGLMLARDVATFYLFFALMTFAAYALVVHDAKAESRRAGRVYIILAVLGEALLLSALVMAATAAGSTDVGEIPIAVSGAARRDLIVCLLFAGFGVKAGVLLLHVWLPLAHPAAPTPASAVLSGAMIKAGLLGWLLFLPLGHAMLSEWGAGVAAVGLAAVFYGIGIGVTQRDPKAVLAYSSISQMGFMTIAVGAALAEPAAASAAIGAATLYAFHHALAKGALFLGVGVSHGVGRVWLPVLVGLLLPALALAGAPLTSGALAKHQLKDAIALVTWGAAIKPWLSIAAIGTALVMARFLVVLTAHRAAHAPGTRAVIAWWGSAIASLVLLSLLPGELILAGGSSSDSHPWSDTWPVLAGAALAIIARSGRWRRWHVPPGDVLGIGVYVAARLIRLFRGCAQRLGAHAQRAFVWTQQRWQQMRSRAYPLSEQGERYLLSHSGASALLVVALLFVLGLLGLRTYG